MQNYFVTNSAIRLCSLVNYPLETLEFPTETPVRLRDLRVQTQLNPSNLGQIEGGPKSKTLGIKIAQKPYVVWSLGPKALVYESLEP